MIHREGFDRGQEVEFQDYRHVWTRGTVKHVEPAEQRIVGPNGTMKETKHSRVHVVYKKSGALKVAVLNPKLVRAL
jgi:hypothetical protein